MFGVNRVEGVKRVKGFSGCSDSAKNSNKYGPNPKEMKAVEYTQLVELR